MLGIAFQRGLLPLSLENIEWGLTETMGIAAADNIKAFHLGRKLVLEPELAHKHELHETYEQFIAKRMEVLKRNHRWGKRWAREFEELVRRSERSIQLGEQIERDLVWRLYDLVEFGTGEYARRYLELVERVYAQDSAERDYAATKAVIWNLHKAMIIKDEVYVAHLLTSEEKTRRDRHRYHVDPERGDKIVYHHLNRPEFNVFGHDIRFKFSPKKWQLNLLKHFRWLRRVAAAVAPPRTRVPRLVHRARRELPQRGRARSLRPLRPSPPLRRRSPRLPRSPLPEDGRSEAEGGGAAETAFPCRSRLACLPHRAVTGCWRACLWSAVARRRFSRRCLTRRRNGKAGQAAALQMNEIITIERMSNRKFLESHALAGRVGLVGGTTLDRKGDSAGGTPRG